jgi:hypothetical protein
MRKRSRNHRLLGTLAIAVVVAAGAYAYANSIGGVNPPPLGSGYGNIGKYALGTVTYNLNTNNPRNIDSVSFRLDNSTSSTVVRVRLINSGGWFNCDESGAPATITCTTTGVTAANANGNTFTVVATG